jgi:hypothetical protein
LKDTQKKRKKTIPVVEKQLSQAAFTMPEMSTSNTQSVGPSLPTTVTPQKTSYIMSEKRMVAPGSKDAPRFKSSKPEELRRFIRLMEDLWKDAGVTSDLAKKTMIGKYADADSEEEWAAFNSFEDGHSWEEFKEELIENYPEAAAAERGTPARLRQICSETAKVRLGDMPALYSFRRAFMAEAKKLRKEPAVMANRELVELFISCLADTLASAVLQYLGNKSADAKAGSVKSSVGNIVARRPEDRYDLDDICQAALTVSENSQGMFTLMNKTEERGVLLLSQPISENRVLTDKLSELEGEQALDKDRMVSLGKTLEARMGGLEEMIKTLMKQGQANEAQGGCKGECKGANCKTHEPSSNPAQKWGGKSLDNEKCFWCGLFGHFQADCEDLKNQIRLGNVKLNQEGKLRLKDGSFIPKFPADASIKERVERLYARKPSQYYYGEYDDNDPAPSAATSVLSQLLGASNDADKRTIAQLKAELDLRKREEALELKQRMWEQSEKKSEQASGSTRTAAVLELLGQLSDEDVAAIKSAKSGFI